MQEDGGAVLVEEVKDSIPRLADPEPGLAEFALDLRGVGIVECRPSYLINLGVPALASLPHGCSPDLHKPQGRFVPFFCTDAPLAALQLVLGVFLFDCGGFGSLAWTARTYRYLH